MPQRLPVRVASLSHQTIEILTERIRSGAYPPGSQLPPENELAAEFSVSRGTIRSAMSSLAARGLVVRRQGIGTFVSQLSRISHPLNEAIDFHELFTRQGYRMGVQFEQSKLIRPDDSLQASLNIGPDDEVLRTHKVFAADGEPVIYCVNHIPMSIFDDELAKEILATPEISEPLFDFLETRCNQRTEYHVASISAGLASDGHYKDIPLEPNTPVLIIEEVGHNQDEMPVWHSYVYYPSSKMSFDLIRWRVPKS